MSIPRFGVLMATFFEGMDHHPKTEVSDLNPPGLAFPGREPYPVRDFPMANCYYTCNLLPTDLIIQTGHVPRWLGNHLRRPGAPARRGALSIHPMTCPYVTKLVAAADELLAGSDDCLVVPGGCDAARRMGDLLAAAYPDRVFVLPMPRSSGLEVAKTLAVDLARFEDWLRTRRPAETAPTGGTSPDAGNATQEPPDLDYPVPPRPGGVFVVAGPLTDDSLLRLIDRLGVHVSGLESCTSPGRWRRLAALGGASGGARSKDAPVAAAATPDYEALAVALLEIGMCPRRSTIARRDHLARRLDESRPTSIIYARQSFCDPGAYDSLLIAALAEERGLRYLEIEVDFPFDANGPLRTRVEAFLEAETLDDDLLGDDLFGDELFGDDLSEEEA